MFRKSHSLSLTCPIHSKPVQYICVASHICNQNGNRKFCDECLQVENDNFDSHHLERINDFLAGDFIYSDMQKMIEALESKLSESYFTRVEQTVEETFNNLQNELNRIIQETKRNILDSLKNRRFERKFILASWQRLQENLENKLEELNQPNSFQKKDLDEYVGLFNEFKSKASIEKSFSKLEEEFERKLLIEDETLKDLKTSLVGTLESYQKSMWDESPNLANPQSINCEKLELENTIQVGKKGFRYYGVKYVKELDSLILYDKESRLSVYSFLNDQVQDLGIISQAYSIEYVPKKRNILLGGKGVVIIKDLTVSMMGEELKEINLPKTDGMVTCLKYIAEKNIVLCSGKFQYIYFLSVDQDFKIVDRIDVNSKNDPLFDCSYVFYLKGRNTLMAGLELGHIHVYQLKEKSVKHILKGHTQRILAIDYSLMRDIMVSASVDGTVRVWIYRKNEFIINSIIHASPEKKKGGVSAVQFIYNSIIMTIPRDVNIQFWESTSGKEITTRQIYHFDSDAALFIEERRIIVAAEYKEGRIYIWRFT